MTEHFALHPDDELYDQARHRQFARDAIKLRFPELTGAELDEKIRVVAAAAARFEAAVTDHNLPRDIS